MNVHFVHIQCDFLPAQKLLHFKINHLTGSHLAYE